MDCTLPINELPLLLVQVTKLKCGAVCLSTNTSHVIADGQSASHFLGEWARIARGEEISLPPVHDRSFLLNNNPISSFGFEFEFGFGFDQPPLLIGEENYLNQKSKKTKMTNLKLTKPHLQKLKDLANKNNTNRPYTRYETITAHMWRVACKARNHKPDQPTAVGICLDLRSRIDPPLPKGYFGDATLDVMATSRSGELIEKPLGYAAGLVRETIMKVSGEFVKRRIEFMEGEEDWSKFREGSEDGPFYGNPNIAVISWLGLTAYGLDFGWGKEVYMGLGEHEFDGDVLICPCQDDGEEGSLIVSLCLQAEYVEDFKKYFYEEVGENF